MVEDSNVVKGKVAVVTLVVIEKSLHPMPTWVYRRCGIAAHVTVAVEAIGHRIGRDKLPRHWIVIPSG